MKRVVTVLPGPEQGGNDTVTQQLTFDAGHQRRERAGKGSEAGRKILVTAARRVSGEPLTGRCHVQVPVEFD
jgi:hypothetical protein